MGNGTELGRVRGLGSAKAGTHHWWHQRLTAGANLLLMLWFIVSIARLPGYDYAAVPLLARARPGSAVPLMLLIVSVFWHFRLGLQVVIEDYVHDEGRSRLRWCCSTSSRSRPARIAHLLDPQDRLSPESPA